MTLDTNILIAYLDGDTEVIQTLSEWREEGRQFFLSAIVEAELLSFSKFSNAERIFVQDFLQNDFLFIPFDRVLARMAGVLRSTVKIKLADAAIAVTALYTHTPLVTKNSKDFKNISELEIISF